MAEVTQALSAIPEVLRGPLLEEYNSIVQNYVERRWTPSELSGGRFCEIVYTILEGYASKNYASRPQKPKNFVAACRSLENNSNVPRSFQILIPRMLSALYEIRNNRGVGHVGGDVDPNHMDSNAVLAMANWIMAELVRVYHFASTSEAQHIVDSLAERRTPFVWQSGEIRRVLDPLLSLKDQVLLLIATCSTKVDANDLYKWTDCKRRSYFNTLLRKLHSQRLIEFSAEDNTVEMLPPGQSYVSQRMSKLA